MARLRSVDISPVFRDALHSNYWRGWARLLLHCLRSIAGNSSGPPEVFCEIVFIASMMSSLVIIVSYSVFPCGCPKKYFGYLTVIVGSGVLKTILYCSFSSSLIFLLLGSKFPLHPGEVQLQLWSLSFFFYLLKYFRLFLIAAIALVSLWFLSVFIEIFILFSIFWSDLVHFLWFDDLLISVFSFPILIFFSSKPFFLGVFGVFLDFSLAEHVFSNFQANIDNNIMHFISFYIC